MMLRVKSISAPSVAVVSYHLMTDGTGRPNYVARALSEMPFLGSVSLVASDYEHISKRRVPEDGVVRLPVRPYTKNISVQRILSYFDFARQVNLAVPVAGADLIYVCVPDYLSALAILRRKRNRRIVVIVDVVDLWPEALPLPRLVNGLVKKTIGLAFKWLRRSLFSKADLVLFQSQYFLNQCSGNNARYGFLPMCLNETTRLDYSWKGSSLAKEIRVLFLGSMNNITDVVSLVQLLCILAEKRKVSLRVVGGGSSLEWLKQRLRTTAVITTFYGITFDSKIKDEELSQAHFGYNGYKETTEVSVSYKSLEYLRHGIPLINSAKGDTFELMENKECGFNYDPKDIQAVAARILLITDAEHARMRQNALRAFEACFSYLGFSTTLQTYIGKLLMDCSADELRYRKYVG